MTRSQALATLMLSEPFTTSGVKAHYRNMARDISLGRWYLKTKPPSVEALREARDVLLGSIGHKLPTCKTCVGSGKVSRGFSLVGCPSCKGTGETNELP